MTGPFQSADPDVPLVGLFFCLGRSGQPSVETVAEQWPFGASKGDGMNMHPKCNSRERGKPLPDGRAGALTSQFFCEVGLLLPLRAKQHARPQMGATPGSSPTRGSNVHGW